jgi:hypothetical protein
MFDRGLYFEGSSDRTIKPSGLALGVRSPNLTDTHANGASHPNRFLLRWNAATPQG